MNWWKGNKMNWILMFCTISLFITQCCSNNIYFPSQNSVSQKVKKCLYMRTHGMFGVDCHDLKLAEIPINLKTNIEILDLTYNRIREIYNNSFENYSDLKILYLTDNSISHIESGAFAFLPDLEILDLTLNSLHVIPDALENLSYLRKLMLGSNPFADVTFTKTLPSIKYLSLSSCKLKKFPDFSHLPSLEQLNISNNRLQTIEISKLAQMCRLKVLDVRKNPRLFRQEHCKCQLVSKWLRNFSQEGFRILPQFDQLCKNTTEGREIVDDPEMCFNNMTNLIFQKNLEIRQSCEVEVLKYESGPFHLQGSVRWVLIVLISISIIVVSAFSLCYIRKRQLKAKKGNRSNDQITPTKTWS